MFRASKISEIKYTYLFKKIHKCSCSNFHLSVLDSIVVKYSKVLRPWKIWMLGIGELADTGTCVSNHEENRKQNKGQRCMIEDCEAATALKLLEDIVAFLHMEEKKEVDKCPSY